VLSKGQHHFFHRTTENGLREKKQEHCLPQMANSEQETIDPPSNDATELLAQLVPIVRLH